MRRPKACPYRRGDGTFWARVRYTDESGKTREKSERAGSQAEALGRSIELVKEYDTAPDVPPKSVTFNKFADSFIPHIEGQRSYKTALGFLASLREHFGNKRLTSITYQDIENYYKKRLKSPSLRTGKRRKRASVNREIALLSKMFNEAVEQGLAAKNPYKDGPPLVKAEQETKRDRILSKEEEERLLAVCTGRRAHLRLVIMAALVTGATKSQLLKLTWGDIHIGLRTITINTREHKAPYGFRMSEALAHELANLHREFEVKHTMESVELLGDIPPLRVWMATKRVFRDFKSAFPSACHAAKIKDLRFNDLRRTYHVRRNATRERIKAAFEASSERVGSGESP